MDGALVKIQAGSTMEKVRSAEFGVRSGGSACALSIIFFSDRTFGSGYIDNAHTILTKPPVSERYYEKCSNALIRTIINGNCKQGATDRKQI